MLQTQHRRISSRLSSQRDPSILHLSLRALETPLNLRDKVEVPIESGFRGQLAALQVGGWVADAGTLRPELVAAGAGEGAGSG
ncbi:hypothetical protein CNMCM6106_004800 [Aspergillus hiratsukae]|uniref:Uncharacterized protein n=1 Tax=Aspergillus hiratsukae TaxID=1194566 RepID=A0A8H6QDE5_9EURO|nr:hypothetical protein CNMCM6106_004800 [Aspergillus hiratsukae]